ncbi:MAG: hypothetical protein U0575_06855 [Phycisphaerales bacterium]
MSLTIPSSPRILLTALADGTAHPQGIMRHVMSMFARAADRRAASRRSPLAPAVGALALGLCAAATAGIQVSYTTILSLDESVTGVRGKSPTEVLLTGSYQNDSAITGLLYSGPLERTDPNGYYYLSPRFPGQMVTSSLFYGPDTSLFNPGLGEGNIRVVGSYQHMLSLARNHGLVYQGALDNSGTWTQIDMPDAIAGGPVWNTIPHSTMGDLVVGGYDLLGQVGSLGAFIHDLVTHTWTVIDFGADTSLTTAYGIWQNGIGSSSYTITGGTSVRGFPYGFLIDYDASTKTLGSPQYYLYPGGTATHFEGITESPGGYNLVAQTSSGAAFVSVMREPSGAFGPAAWTLVCVPGATITTGNSVYQNSAMGISFGDGTPGVHSYVATVSIGCVGDINRDGIVDGADLGVLLGNWGSTTCAADSTASDLNQDGVVNGADLGILVSSWGPCPGMSP